MDQSLLRIKIDKFNVSVWSSCGLSFLISCLYYDNYADGYRLMIIFPVVFFVVYLLLLQSLRDSNLPFTAYGIIGMEWIRLVLMPPVCAIAGENVGFPYINPSENSLFLAVLLIVYELIVVAIISRFFLGIRSNSIKKASHKLILQGSKTVYIVFLFITFIILLTIGRNSNLISFLYIPVSDTVRIGDLHETHLVLARQFLIIGFFIVFLWAVSWCKSRYEKSRKVMYLDIAIIIALLNVAVIIGERRTFQIYTALVTTWVLIRTFPIHKKRIVVSIGTFAAVVLALMSIYKFFAAFQYGSYIGALYNSNADIGWFARNLQSYFFGPENIAATIDFSLVSHLDVKNMLFDFFRSIFGVHFLLKQYGVLTAEYFNTYIYGSSTATGHVISAIGYGYIYLGALLSPLITLFNIIICSMVEKYMYMSKSYEMTYVWGYVLARFVTNLFVNPPPLISSSTIMLGTGGVLFVAAFMLKRLQIA